MLGTPEPHILARPGLLQSACAKPQQHYHYGGIFDVVSLAVVLLFGIAANHPFIQGNKRTGFAAMLIFLQDNSFDLELADDPEFADELIASINDGVSQEMFAVTVRAALKPFAPD